MSYVLLCEARMNKNDMKSKVHFQIFSDLYSFSYINTHGKQFASSSLVYISTTKTSFSHLQKPSILYFPYVLRPSFTLPISFQHPTVHLRRWMIPFSSKTKLYPSSLVSSQFNSILKTSSLFHSILLHCSPCMMLQAASTTKAPCKMIHWKVICFI